MPVHISEIDTRGGAVTDVPDYSIYIYDADGTVHSGPSGLGTRDNTVNGHDVYVLEHHPEGPPGIQRLHGVALVGGSGDAVHFLSLSWARITATEGPASGNTSRDIGAQPRHGSTQSSDGGAAFSHIATPNKGTVPCFARGTLIQTGPGQTPVECLRVGDLVWTQGRGFRATRWLRHSTQPLTTLRPGQRPVLIRHGALGQRQPRQDLAVSPSTAVLWVGRAPERGARPILPHIAAGQASVAERHPAQRRPIAPPDQVSSAGWATIGDQALATAPRPTPHSGSSTTRARASNRTPQPGASSCSACRRGRPSMSGHRHRATGPGRCRHTCWPPLR